MNESFILFDGVSPNTSTSPPISSPSPHAIASKIAYSYVLPIVCILGIIGTLSTLTTLLPEPHTRFIILSTVTLCLPSGNVTNLIVLASRRLRAVSYMYLRALAVADLLCMIFVGCFIFIEMQEMVQSSPLISTVTSSLSEWPPAPPEPHHSLLQGAHHADAHQLGSGNWLVLRDGTI